MVHVKRVHLIHEKDSRHKVSEALGKVSVHKMFTNKPVKTVVKRP
jgi:hypothetical protein